ncbi:DUF1178 family protein [Chitinivorax sp. PXF-14]|uniref:DUF1178 family protein n=1 Tax=Chitinivorax sp. PXF-14 TaxID=3230488 RepID=UPI0034664728
MVVYDIGCGAGHKFEGWFASSEDFDTQMQRALVQCPLCGTHKLRKLPATAVVNVGQQPELPDGAEVIDLGAVLRGLREHVLSHSEDVGHRFPEEVRRILRGDAPERLIRGAASRVEVETLADEGIAVMSLADVPEDNLH